MINLINWDKIQGYKSACASLKFHIKYHICSLSISRFIQIFLFPRIIHVLIPFDFSQFHEGNITNSMRVVAHYHKKEYTVIRWASFSSSPKINGIHFLTGGKKIMNIKNWESSMSWPIHAFGSQPLVSQDSV